MSENGEIYTAGKNFTLPPNAHFITILFLQYSKRQKTDQKLKFERASQTTYMRNIYKYISYHIFECCNDKNDKKMTRC